MLPARPSFAGHGLFERLRSTAFALLGTTAALALGLVALAAHQGWPDFPIAPIPGNEAKVGVLDSPVARAANTPGGERVDARADIQPAASRSREDASGEAGFLGSRRRTEPPPAASVGVPAGVEAAPAPVSGGPTPSAPQQLASSPASPVPAPSPAPSAPPVAALSSPGKGHAYGKLKTGPPPKPVHPAPPASAPAATPLSPPTAPTSPPASQEVSEGPGQGHGHAYGHGK
jgi:hypothetical protein